MRIGFIVSPYDSVPPSSREILAPWYLAEVLIGGLVKRGHTVTAFCAQGSRLPCEVVTAGIEPDYPQRTTKEPLQFLEESLFREQALAQEMVSRSVKGAFDCLHVYHGISRVASVVSLSSVPVVATLHNPVTQKRRFMYERYPIQYIFLSESHRRTAPELLCAGVVANGIDLSQFPFQGNASDYLLFMGRLVSEKGLHSAIAVALATNVQLEIGTRFPDKDKETPYFTEKIKPFLENPLIGEPGMVTGENKLLLYKQAKALLFPIEWDEPFGMVMIEAMVCGTPVVAYNRGSVPEIVRDGVTGFIVDSDNEDRPGKGSWIIKKQGIDGLIEGTKRIDEIGRAACRRHVEEHFTMEKMVEGYEKAYEKAIGSK